MKFHQYSPFEPMLHFENLQLDSSTCYAAVHASKLTVESGGLVTIDCLATSKVDVILAPGRP